MAAHPLTSRERGQTGAAARKQAFAALWDRAGQQGGRRGKPTHESPQEREIVSTRHAAPAHQTARIEPAREMRKTHSRVAAQEPRHVDADIAETDAAANAHTQDRVHAWYRAQHPNSAANDGDTAEVSLITKPTARPTQRPLTTIAAASRPDLSVAPQKATSADFAHAAAAQRETITAARDQQVHQTTADDDNADAESRIPSTAPTEREPAPFVHGSFEDGQPVSDISSSHSRRLPAPIVRQSPVATASVASNIGPPEHVDLKHRGDGLSTAIAAEQAASSTEATRTAKIQIPGAIGADKSHHAIQALAEQTAASPTPALKLPAPPSGALRKELPAVAAVESGARRRELGPAIASGMAEENFDADGAPATARTAVALAAPTPIAGLVPVRTHALSPDNNDANLSPAAVVSVNLFDRQGHLILVPPMKGSHEILVHQNQMAVADGLDRIQDDGDLLELRQRKLLVTLPDEDSTYPDDRLPSNRRYARPWTVRFLRDLARAHYARFGTPLIVTSAARTVEFQRHLVRVNGNAAPPTGDVASPHLYGQAIDIGKGRMSLTELTWMRAYLTPVENDGKIDVEEEFQQSCFHISVYRRYLGLPAPQRTGPPAQMLTAKEAPAPDSTRPVEKKHRRISTAMLATGLR